MADVCRAEVDCFALADFFPEDWDDFAADFAGFVFFAAVFLVDVVLPFEAGVTAHTARAVQSASAITYAVERKLVSFPDLLNDPAESPTGTGLAAIALLPPALSRYGRGPSSEWPGAGEAPRP